MTKLEYEEKVKDILNSLYDQKQVEVEYIDELKSYYPTRLGIIIADALRRKIKNPNEVWIISEFSFLCMEEYAYPFIEDYVRACQIEYSQVGYDIHRYRLENYKKLLDGATNLDIENSIVNWNSDKIPQNDENILYRFFEASDFVSYGIHRAAVKKRNPEYCALEYLDWIWNQSGMGDLYRELSDESNTPIVCIENQQNRILMRCLAEDLYNIGKEVYIITNEKIDEVNGYTVIIAEEIQHETYAENNIDEIIRNISDSNTENSILYIVADDEVTTALEMSELLYRNFTRMAGKTNFPFWGRCMQFSRYGDYCDSMSVLYGEDCKQLINKDCTVKYSIIIPARNSSETLRYTIETCLGQDCEGDYEVLISDNSSENNMEVYNLFQSINNSKLRYIKTPRDLRLVKSFEYAYLHAYGEYVMALGSDDGALPWMLSTLDSVISRYPDEEIIQWERGFYAWPGFNGGQQHKLIIPREYSNVDIYMKDCRDSIAEILNDYQNMYSLPMLYINSCCKRSYLKALYERTGRLWDGISQDIDMGIITLALHDHILNIQYPLTIAGMSGASAGAAANIAKHTHKEVENVNEELLNVDNVEGYGRCYLERLVPTTQTDVNLMYASILRAIQRRLLPEYYLTDIINWKKWYIDIVSLLDVRDAAYDRLIHETQMCASFHGEEFLQWFNENIYERVMTPKHKSEFPPQKEGRNYKVGRDENGTLTLDASEYGVTNIKEAVDLFVEQMRNI